MTAKEILAKVKAIFADQPAMPAMPPAEPGEPNDPPTGVDSVLQDGRVMHCDPAMQVGAKCTIDGQPTPAGDYTMQDGTVCTVDDSGTITNVAGPAPITTDPPAEPTFDERLKMLEDAVAKLVANPAPAPVQYATEVQLSEANAKIEKQDKVIAGLFELAEKLAETPTAEPTTLTGNKKNHFDRKLKSEKRLEGIGAAISQLKNKN